MLVQLTGRNRRGAADGKEQTKCTSWQISGRDRCGAPSGTGYTLCKQREGTDRRRAPSERDTLCNVQVTGRNRRGAANSKEQRWCRNGKELTWCT